MSGKGKSRKLVQVLFSVNMSEQCILLFSWNIKKKNACKHGDKESYFLVLLLAGSLIWKNYLTLHKVRFSIFIHSFVTNGRIP